MINRSFDDLQNEIEDLWDRAEEIEPVNPEKARELNLQAHELIGEQGKLLNL